MSWLFVDPVCPTPYSPASLNEGGIGGTEATVVRIAEALGERETVCVMQHSRKVDQVGYNANYIRPDFENLPPFSAVVVLRCPDSALAMRQRFQSAPVYLWCHDLANKRLGELMPKLQEARIKVIAVSQFHRHNIMEAARTYSAGKTMPEILIIPNPIEDTLHPDATPVNPNKLIFFSSPHKGLKHTLHIFDKLRNFNPKLELFIANPGYIKLSPEPTPGVTFLGALPRKEALQHVREAFCVLYLNPVFPETFGLVFAEANAVGTPVLTHPIGAAREVLDNPQQFVDVLDVKRTVDQFLSWQQPGNRPKVAVQDKFRMISVAGKWRALD